MIFLTDFNDIDELEFNGAYSTKKLNDNKYTITFPNLDKSEKVVYHKEISIGTTREITTYKLSFTDTYENLYYMVTNHYLETPEGETYKTITHTSIIDENYHYTLVYIDLKGF